MKFRRILRYGLAVGLATGGLASLHFNQWDLATHGFVRFGRAAITAARIIVDYKTSLWNVDKESEKYQNVMCQVHKRAASHLLDLCCANKGAFIKVGQHIGALDHLLPKEYVSTLCVLHANAPMSSLDDVLLVLKEDLKKEPSELFASFEPEPIGAASLAQVHKAVTKDGEVVAVKVQHRFVKSRAVVDMKTMEVLTRIAAFLFPDFKLLWLAEEVKRNLPTELDFMHEGRNAERVSRMFSHYSWLKVPVIYWDLSAGRVLTMEYCEGGQVNDRQYVEKHGISAGEVTRYLGKLFSEMIFIHGYVHCDPHPGNILIQKCDGSLKIVLLDHGLYSTLTDSFRLKYANMWLSIINSDVEGMKRNADHLGVKGNLYAMLASMLTARAWSAVASGIDKHVLTDKEKRQIGQFVAANLHLLSDVLNVVPREMLLLFKTNDLLRSIDYALKSPMAGSAFISISRCCVRAVTQAKMLTCKSIFCKMRNMFIERWILMKISVYELYFWFKVCFGQPLEISINNFLK